MQHIVSSLHRQGRSPFAAILSHAIHPLVLTHYFLHQAHGVSLHLWKLSHYLRVRLCSFLRGHVGSLHGHILPTLTYTPAIATMLMTSVSVCAQQGLRPFLWGPVLVTVRQVSELSGTASNSTL